MFVKAIAAVNWAVISRLERDFSLFSAFGAGYSEHLPLFAAVAMAFTFVAAFTTPHGLILKAAFLIEFLFARTEDEFFAAVLAYECFVFKSHVDKSPYN